MSVYLYCQDCCAWQGKAEQLKNWDKPVGVLRCPNCDSPNVSGIRPSTEKRSLDHE